MKMYALRRFLKHRFYADLCMPRSVRVMKRISTVAVALSVCALVISLSVGTGFERAYREALMGFNSHLVVMNTSGTFPVEEIEKIKSIVGDDLLGATPFLYREALAIRRGEVRGVVLKGIDPATYTDVSDVKISSEANLSTTELFRGNSSSGPHGGIVGLSLAEGLEDGEIIRVMIPDDHGGKFVEMPVLGTFESGINDYDSQFILMRIEELEKMFGLNSGEITGVEIKLRDPDSSEKIGSTITDEMGLLYEVTTWQELNSDLFSAIKLEKVVSSIIMGSMVVVSMLNLMALIVLMMMKRLPQISLLKAIGLCAAEIEKLLISGGLLVARKGVIAGLAGGLIISLIIQRFRIIELDPEIYLINSLPVEVSPAICGTVLAFCMAAAYAASKVAAKRVAQGISMEGLKIR